MDDEILKECEALIDKAMPGGIDAWRQRVACEVYQIACERHYSKQWMKVDATRTKNVIHLSWTYEYEKPLQYSTSINIGIIEFETPKYLGKTTLCRVIKDGDGGTHVTLEEGHTYFFKMLFAIKDETRKPPEYWDTMLDITFTMDIPLPAEKRKLLNKALKLEANPEERIQHEVETMFNCEDKFDELFKAGIERIKAKKLPKKEEIDRIGRLKEKFGLMKYELNM